MSVHWMSTSNTVMLIVHLINILIKNLIKINETRNVMNRQSSSIMLFLSTRNIHLINFSVGDSFQLSLIRKKIRNNSHSFINDNFDIL